jgi:DNA-binding NarL/FixJ family response regulator
MSLHSYVEFNFGAQLRPAQMQMPPQVDLTQREREVARFACAGCTNAEIARRLSIGIATVKTHLVNIFGKLGVSNRTALVNRMLGQKGSAAYQ